MPDNELLEIRVSRVIPAEKWRVIRILTRVWEFPSFIPSVREATVLNKSGNKMVTKWRIQVDKVPISWVEEDTLELNQNKISFRLKEGDLEEFSGEWRFSPHPEGTEVSVIVHLRVGVPAIKDFADNYIRKLIVLSFEAILEAIERKLISLKYISYRKGNTEKIAGFGIIGHLYNYHHLESCFHVLNPGIKLPSREFLGQLFHLTPSFKLYDILDFKSKTGDSVNGTFIIATFIPDMIEKDIWVVFSKVVKACKLAEKKGVGIVTLGGFTSIVAERVGQEIAEQVDVAVTTGNSFTAAMAVEGVLKATKLMGKDISGLKIAVVGGTGDIGSACARVLTDKVRQLTITGRTKINLTRMNKELSRHRKAKIVATTDNQAAVRDADIVISAASATSSILKVDWFKSGSIICDVGYPKNISYTPTDRKDIFIFSGGLSKPPTSILFPIDVGLPATNALYGCFSESIILALEKRYENFSFGRGNITPEKMQEIKSLGEKHGFVLADFYWGHKQIDTAMVESIKEAVNA
ncbi:MAG: SRPBCC family protein [Candidatus Omnitrophota bacterium]